MNNSKNDMPCHRILLLNNQKCVDALFIRTNSYLHVDGPLFFCFQITCYIEFTTHFSSSCLSVKK